MFNQILKTTKILLNKISHKYLLTAKLSTRRKNFPKKPDGKLRFISTCCKNSPILLSNETFNLNFGGDTTLDTITRALVYLNWCLLTNTPPPHKT
jgi:hypothetical protein